MPDFTILKYKYLAYLTFAVYHIVKQKGKKFPKQKGGIYYVRNYNI